MNIIDIFDKADEHSLGEFTEEEYIFLVEFARGTIKESLVAHIIHNSLKYENNYLIFKELVLSNKLNKFHLDYIFDFLFRVNYFKISEEKAADEDGFFPYIPYDPISFSRLLAKTKKYHKKNFIDIGHGTGQKILLAGLYGDFDSISGIEYNKLTYRISQTILLHIFNGYLNNNQYNPKLSLQERNALYHDYSKYDYIYMYKPMSDEKLMHELYKQVLSTAPIGALIVNVLDFISVFDLTEFKFKMTKEFRNEYSYAFILIKTGKNTFNVEEY